MRLRDDSILSTRDTGGRHSDTSKQNAKGAAAEQVDQGDQVKEPHKETGAPFSETAAELDFLEPDEGSGESDGALPVVWSDCEHDSRGSNRETSKYARDLQGILSRLAKPQSVQRTSQRIVVAGVNKGDDASTVAQGLAATCAGSGFSVLLVDANLDRPTAHRHFGVSNDAGLSDLLSSTDSPHRLPQCTALPNLAVIAAGPRSSNFSSLLARESLFHRLEPIAHHFDYIIADAGSLPAALVARVSTGADNVLIAAREHVSSIRDLENLLRTLEAEAAPEPAVLMIG